MTEFTQNMSGDSRYSIKLTVTEVLPSDYITTNKTNVNYTLTATKSAGSGYWNNNANNPVKVTINGVDVVDTNIAYDFRNATPKTITLATGTVTGIEHNADGTKTINVSGYFKDNGNSLGQATASGTLTLTTIPRASQPTLYTTGGSIRTFATLGENLKIEIARASSSFTHTLQIKIGNSVIEQFTNVGDEKNPWTPSISTYAPYITTSSSTTATIVCTTYNGSTSLGTKSQTITINVPNNSNTAPTASISLSKGNNVVPSSWGVYVKGKSKLNVVITGTPKYGTSITSYSSTTNGTTSNSSSYTTSELTTVGSNTITATVKDARGFTSSQASATYTVVNYVNPQVNLTVERCNSSGTLDDSGTYVKYTCTGSIADVSDKNSKTFTFKYKEKTSSTWTTISDSTWNNSYTLSKSSNAYGSGNIDITKEYVFRLEATDQFGTVFKEAEIGTVADLMNFAPNGKSMAFGGVSQRSGNEAILDNNLTNDFKKPTYFSDYVVNNGFIRGRTISGGGGTAGYFYVCDITNEGTYTSQFLEFTFMQRNRYGKMILKLNGSSTSGAIGSVTAYLVLTNDSAFKAYYLLSNNKVQLYVQKSESWDNMDVLVRKGGFEIGKAKITWVDTTVSSLPSGYAEIFGATLRVNVTGSAGSASTWSGNTALTNDHATVNTSDTWIPVIASGKIQHTLRKFASSQTHTDYNNNQHYLPTMSFLSYWNGAYNSSGNSNLIYCNKGTIASMTNHEAYSTSEQQIGTWINGEKLYRKVFTFNFTNSTDVSITHNISNLKQVINYYGGFKENNTNRFIPQFYPTNMQATYSIAVYSVSSTTIWINGNTWVKNNYTSLNSGFIVLEYTKTS